MEIKYLTKKAFTFMVILSIFFLVPLRAAASNNTCWLRAVNDDVFVKVFDVDRAGNSAHGNSYSKYFLDKREIWEGKLNKSQTISIKSANGKIRYDFKASSGYRTYGNNTATCSHGEIIRLP